MDLSIERGAFVVQKEYEKLFEVYQKLSESQRSSVFTCMVGEKYFKRDMRFMLVGRAANGWEDEYDTSSSETFANSAMRYFENRNRWEWIKKNNNGKLYAGKDDNGRYFAHSRFWSYTKDIYAGLLNGEEDDARVWMENIAWSNLYKISPSGGNPSLKSIKLQYDEGCCPDILDKEIEHLRPTHILFETDYDWLFEGIKSKLKKTNGTYIRARGTYKCATAVVMTRPEKAKKTMYVTECLEGFGVF